MSIDRRFNPWHLGTGLARKFLRLYSPQRRAPMLAAIGIVLATGAFAFHEISLLTAAQDTVIRSEQILADSESLSAATYRVESDSRGYVIYPRDWVMASRETRRRAAEDLWAKLDAETLGNPAQHQRVLALHEAMEARFDFLAHVIDLRNSEGPDGVTRMWARGERAVMQAELHQRIMDVEEAEQQQLAVRLVRTHRDANITRTLILFAAFPAVIGLGLLSLVTIQLLKRSTKLQAKLSNVNGMLKTLLNTAPVGIFTYSDMRHIGFWNPAAEKIFGLSAKRVVGEVAANLPAELNLLLCGLHGDNGVSTIGSHGDNSIVTWTREPGKEMKLRISAAQVNGQSGEIASVAIVQDVTEFHRLEEELIHIAHHDTLTGLPNRVVLDDRFSQMLKRTRRDGKKCAVFEVDIDRFKQINDQHGHDVGDQYLREVATRLSSALRSTDTIVRVGGDEFVCLVESLQTEEDAELVARKLIASLAEPIKLEQSLHHASISIGMAIYPTDATQAKQLRKQADAALYRAKANGKGQFKRYERNDADTRRRHIQDVLERGIERHSFHLVYQPQYTKTGVLRGFEALLRLSDPVLGPLSPAEFIPIAEQCGLIHDIGNWVLQQGCTTFASWVRRGLAPGILAMNVSAAQFVRGNFSEIVAETLVRTGLSPEYVELELTESMVMTDIEESSRQMHRLKKAGVSLAIDDFGTGYSSLNHLHRLPIDLIKIDRSFVSEIDQETATTRPIVEAIVGLGKSLAIETIAEGVETDRQRHYLCEIGCDYLQGFFFARPLPVLEAEARLSRAIQHAPSETIRFAEAAPQFA